MEWIKIAKEKGIKFGRPKVVTPPNTNDILDRYINHEITNTEAASLIGVSRGTFFRLVKERKTWFMRSSTFRGQQWAFVVFQDLSW